MTALNLCTMFASVKRICKWPPVKDEKTKDKVVKKEEEEEEEARTEEKKVEKTRHPLTDVTYDDLPEFMAKGVFDCKVIRVYDGDTIWVGIKTAGDDRTWRVCCRLIGMDAPEMPRSHVDAMTDYHKMAFAARDRLVELLTGLSIEPGSHFDTSGIELPSLTDQILQQKLDRENHTVLERGLEIEHGKDKYGRYLARIRTVEGGDAAEVMIREGHAVPYSGGHREAPGE